MEIFSKKIPPPPDGMRGVFNPPPPSGCNSSDPIIAATAIAVRGGILSTAGHVK